MKELFLIAILYQITSIISESSFPLFRWMRTLPYYIGDLFGCFLCVSVWVGLFGSLILNISNNFGFDSHFLSVFFYSFCLWWIHLLEAKISE